MTLIAYKNGVMAADKRTSHHNSHDDKTKCSHCDGKTDSVSDESAKIRISNKSFFRGEAVRSFAGAGERSLIARLCSIISGGESLEDMYSAYLKVQGLSAARHNGGSCTLMLVGVRKLYIVKAPPAGKLIITEKELTDTHFIGSGAVLAKVVNRFTKASPMAIVNMVMDMESSVGGGIDYIDLNQETLEVKEYAKQDPKMIMDIAHTAYATGVQAVLDTQERKKPGRKPRDPNAPVKKRNTKPKQLPEPNPDGKALGTE